MRTVLNVSFFFVDDQFYNQLIIRPEELINFIQSYLIRNLTLSRSELVSIIYWDLSVQALLSPRYMCFEIHFAILSLSF